MAILLTADLAAAQLPNLVALRRRFAPDPAVLPEVSVYLTLLVDYDQLLSAAVGEAA